jgi:ferrochelatase
MDRRIVNVPSLIWKPLLNGIVLRMRPAKTVRIYQSIWTPDGSPYALHSQALEQALKQALEQVFEHTLAQELATHDSGKQGEQGEKDGPIVRMTHRYGNPSMKDGLHDFKQQGVKQIIVLPLYPQQAFATTASARDELNRQLTALDYAPQITFIEDYHTEPLWIEAVANSIRPYLATQQSQNPPSHLLFSFHSIPLKDIRNGDRYQQQVEQSVASIAANLGLKKDSFSWAYQSRFDDTQRWLDPFILRRITELKGQGVERLLIVCPGFAVDCTETLYDITNRLACEVSAANLDIALTYIPCLNESPSHAKALASVVGSKITLPD